MSTHLLTKAFLLGPALVLSLSIAAPRGFAQTSARGSNPVITQSHPAPPLALVQELIRQRHPDFRRRDIPRRHSVFTLVMNSRGEAERTALIENEEATKPISATAEFLASQFPDAQWEFQNFRRAGTAIFRSTALSPDPLLVVWFERK